METFAIPNKSLLDAGTSIVPADTRSAPRERLWVTCFGFPPGQPELIIQYFVNVRDLNIQDYSPKSGEAMKNWVHIKFLTQKDVAIALGESGKVLDLNGQKIMVGLQLAADGQQLDSGPAIVIPKSKPRTSSFWEKAARWIMDM